MKKLLYAVAAFAVLFTSCAKDDAVAPVEDKEALVSFCVNSPAVATRYGEGTTAQDLYYAVYDTQEGFVAGLSATDTPVTINISTTVNLNLVQGRSYEIIFWAQAQAEDAPYTLTWGNTADEAKMTYKPQATLTANNEKYDAFYAYVEPFEVKGAVSQTVELKRPFAQLNVATADYEKAETAGVVITKTGVKVKGVYNCLNLKSGAVPQKNAAVELTFDMADMATGTIEANGKAYKHIAMNYLLVNDKELVDVTLTLSEDNGNAATDLTRNYSSVPVQRNYRTNIVGNILTSTADFNVEIKPGFADEDEIYVAPEITVVESYDQLTAALEAGKRSIVLDADITTDKSCTFTYGTDTRSEQSGVTIDLNGKTFEITDPSGIFNIGDKDNKTKPNVTIKNGNINCIVYALSGDVTLSDINFGGTIAYVKAAQGVISVKHANLTAERCDMKNVKASAADSRPRAFCSEGRSGGYLKLIDCNFPSSSDGTGAFVATKLLRTYINPLSGSAQLELTNCKFGVAANIDASASYSFSNMNLTGCSGGFTFTIPRSKDSLTEEETAIMKAIKNNNSGTIKAYYNGTLVTY